MRRLLLAVSIAALIAAAVPSVQAASPLRASVRVGDDFFKPTRVTIRKNGKVTWRWVGSNPHNVAISKPRSSKIVRRSRIVSSGSFTYKFRSTGTWRAICEVHPSDMRMRIVVRSS